MEKFHKIVFVSSLPTPQDLFLWILYRVRGGKARIERWIKSDLLVLFAMLIVAKCLSLKLDRHTPCFYLIELLSLSYMLFLECAKILQPRNHSIADAFIKVSFLTSRIQITLKLSHALQLFFLLHPCSFL